MQSKISRLKIFTYIYGFGRPYWFAMILGTLMYCSQTVFDTFMFSQLSGGVTNAIVQRSSDILIYTIIKVIFILFAFLLVAYFGVLLYVSSTVKARRRMQTKMFRSFMSADAEGREHSGEQLSRLNNDVLSANDLFSNAFTQFLFPFLPIVIYSITLFVMEWRVGLFALAAGLLGVVGQAVFVKPLAKIASENLEAVARATKTIGDIFSGGIIARVFKIEDKLEAAFGQDNEAMRRLINREANISAGQKLLSGISEIIATGGVFIVGGFLVQQGQITVVELMMMFPMCANVAMFIGLIGSAWAGMQAPFEAGRRIYDVLGGDNDVPHLPGEEAVSIANADRAGGYKIEVKDLNFAYKGAEKDVLSHVNFTVEENVFAVFVGESGSGKSTLLKLIAGLFDRDNLNITVGNTKFCAEQIDEYRSLFAYVEQSAKLFNLAVAENIALGRAGATREEVIAAAKEADADSFITALPQGYDTPVGEVGGSLSGGQRQRIAIARALIRRSPILVFDEATSALDKESEREVVATINRLHGKHTILMITHNASAVKPDVTFTVENGQVK